MNRLVGDQSYRRYLWCQKCEAGYQVHRVWLHDGQWRKEYLLESRESMLHSLQNSIRQLKEKGEKPLPEILQTVQALKEKPRLRGLKRFEELKAKYSD